jgi:hypothetical protein
VASRAELNPSEPVCAHLSLPRQAGTAVDGFALTDVPLLLTREPEAATKPVAVPLPHNPEGPIGFDVPMAVPRPHNPEGPIGFDVPMAMPRPHHPEGKFGSDVLIALPRPRHPEGRVGFDVLLTLPIR